ncbi:MAG: hypothetical protein AAF368_20845 [Planctomycetota bacterium]
MEESTFLASAVAEELNNSYIELRVHYDKFGEPETMVLNEELRSRYVEGSIAAPIYTVIDPASRDLLRREDGVIAEGKFLRFLQGS